jgi:hypothetical protein
VARDIRVKTSVVLGDNGYIQGLVYEPDGTTPMDLTGFSVELTFWKPDAAEPHASRLAKVTDPTNGIFLYLLRGDEYATASADVLWQVVLHKTEFNSTSSGRGGFRYVSAVGSSKVLPTP